MAEPQGGRRQEGFGVGHQVLGLPGLCVPDQSDHWNFQQCVSVAIISFFFFFFGLSKFVLELFHLQPMGS